MNDISDFRAIAEHKLETARQLFEAGIYASSVIVSYLAAAREIVFKQTLVRSSKPDAVRRRLTTLVWCGLEFDPALLKLLKTGRRRMIALDYAPGVVAATRQEAADYTALTRAFLDAARAVCD